VYISYTIIFYHHHTNPNPNSFHVKNGIISAFHDLCDDKTHLHFITATRPLILCSILPRPLPATPGEEKVHKSCIVKAFHSIDVEIIFDEQLKIQGLTNCLLLKPQFEDIHQRRNSVVIFLNIKLL